MLHMIGGILIGISTAIGRRDTFDWLISLLIAIVGIVVLELA